MARTRASAPAPSSASSIGELCEDLALERRDRRGQARVDVLEGVVERLGGAARHQRGELDELEVAHDAVSDVEVGVEAQLAEPRAQPGDVGEELVAALAEHRLECLGGAEQLLLAGLPRRVERDARLLGKR